MATTHDAIAAELDDAETLEKEAGALIERTMLAYRRDGEHVSAARLQSALTLIEGVEYVAALDAART